LALAVTSNGAGGRVTVTAGAFAVVVCAALSVTVSTAVKVPAAVYEWDGFWLVDAAEPSPKFQLYEYGATPPDAEPVKLTASGALPEVGLAPALAARGGTEALPNRSVIALAEPSVVVSVGRLQAVSIVLRNE
jgi:hypothetical protein